MTPQPNNYPDFKRNAAVTPPVLWWLRLEGLAVSALGIVLYARTGASWWLFTALWLVPDLSMIGYFAGPKVGSNCYNVVHSYILPAALAISALVLHQATLLPCALIWFNHIGVDRLLGYGLKYPSGFGITHLSPSRKTPLPNASAPQP